MSDLGDEFVVESYLVPWLIWIQLVVMILLIIILFFGFTVFTLEPSSSSTASSSITAASASPPPHLNNSSSSQRRAKAEVQRTTIADRATSAEFTREEAQNEESSSKDASFSRIFRNPNHPCDYLGLAKRAVLKCLGLDSSSEPSGSDQHEKQE